MPGIFSTESTAEQLKKLESLPAEEAHVGAVAKQGGDVGVEVEGSKVIGKGWSVAGSLEWMKKQGWAAVAGLNWKGKDVK